MYHDDWEDDFDPLDKRYRAGIVTHILLVFIVAALMLMIFSVLF